MEEIKVGPAAVSASPLVKSPDSHAREPPGWKLLFFCFCDEKKIFIAEFNEITPTLPKRDESKAAVRGRKVTGLALLKNIAEFNEIRTLHSEGGCIRGRLTMKLCAGDGSAGKAWKDPTDGV